MCPGKGLCFSDGLISATPKLKGSLEVTDYETLGVWVLSLCLPKPSWPASKPFGAELQRALTPCQGHGMAAQTEELIKSQLNTRKPTTEVWVLDINMFLSVAQVILIRSQQENP